MKPSTHLRLGLLALLLVPAWLFAQEVGPVAQPYSSSGPTNNGFAPFAGPGTGDRPKNARTEIDCTESATFDNASNTAEFAGHVVVHDPQFDMTCDKLHAVMRPDRKGLQQVIATGNVVITQQKTNERGDLVTSIGKAGKATYNAATGDMTLEEWPQIQQGINNQIATQKETVMILNAKGRSRTIGSSRTMIVDQGEKAVTP
jgi:lipopolysaccharide transport protein LptA